MLNGCVKGIGNVRYSHKFPQETIYGIVRQVGAFETKRPTKSLCFYEVSNGGPI